jgi:hypothetical protein
LGALSCGKADFTRLPDSLKKAFTGRPSACDAAKAERAVAEVEARAMRDSLLAESRLHGARKEAINRQNLEAMNMRLQVYWRLHGKAPLTFGQVVEILPAPAVDIFCGKSAIASNQDGSGGWWWNARRQRLESNPLE